MNPTSNSLLRLISLLQLATAAATFAAISSGVLALAAPSPAYAGVAVRSQPCSPALSQIEPAVPAARAEHAG